MLTSSYTIEYWSGGVLISTETIEVELTPEEIAEREARKVTATGITVLRVAPGDEAPPIGSLQSGTPVTDLTHRVNVGGVAYAHIESPIGTGWVRALNLIPTWRNE